MTEKDVPDEKHPVMYSVTMRKSLIDFYMPISGAEFKLALKNAVPVKPVPRCAKCEEPLGSRYYQGVPTVAIIEGSPEQINMDLCLTCHKDLTR